MHLTACVKGAIESTVESMGSKLEHRNMEGRRITTEHLNEEVFVTWVALKFNTVIMSYEEHSTDILVHGKEWHFITSRLVKFHTVAHNFTSS